MYDYANALKPAGTLNQYSDIITIRIKRVTSQHFFNIVWIIVRILLWGGFSQPGR
ncbi:hypothetical protein SPRA44_320031 [Serratia proteamaculans]|nr:hypothetical protein SPRA44_320031 [Serratia proteamaculans]